jgi:hypothetical protein
MYRNMTERDTKMNAVDLLNRELSLQCSIWACEVATLSFSTSCTLEENANMQTMR